MDLLSLVLILQPTASSESSPPLPHWWGKSTCTLLQETFQQVGSPFAFTFNDSVPQPFTVSSLIGNFPNQKLSSEERYTLRLTSLNVEATNTLLTLTSSGGPLSPETRITLANFNFRVLAIAIHPDQHPWAGSTTYRELGSLVAEKKHMSRFICLRFASPLSFFVISNSRKKQPVGFPKPDLVFDSLLTRWNRFAPLPFPPELIHFARERIRLKSFQLPVGGWWLSNNLHNDKFGEITFLATEDFEPYWLSLLHSLANFAPFAGIGNNVMEGYGQCVLKNANPKSPIIAI